MKKTHRWFTLEDIVHFVIFRELDKMRVPFAYEKATKVCLELREAVQYRRAEEISPMPLTPRGKKKTKPTPPPKEEPKKD